jgi:nitrite reductase/ring-hydroxylating ferredoxin subunit
MAMRFQTLEKLINLHNGYRRQFRIDSLHLLLLQQDDEVYLLEARCPHRDQSLDAAGIDQGSIECPQHHYRFSLRDGALISFTEEPCRALRIYELVYEGNEVGVLVPD